MGLEFAPVPADPATVEAEALAWRQQVGTVDASGKATTNAFKTVVSSWFDALHDWVSAAPEPMITEAERLRGDLLFNAGTLDFWANALRVLEQTRSGLIAQYDGAGPSYGAVVEGGDTGNPGAAAAYQTKYETAVKTAKAELEAALTSQYDLAVGELDEAANQVAAMMEEGATPENLQYLYEIGAIPRGDVPFFYGWTDIFDLSQGMPEELEGKTAAEIEQLILADPALAQWAMGNRPGTGSADPAEQALAEAMNAPGTAEDKMDAVRAAFDAMSPEDRDRMAVLFPGVVGNLNGVPFSLRAKSNRIAVYQAQPAEEARLAELKAQLAHLESLPESPMNDPNKVDKDDLREQIAESEGLLDRYDEFLGSTDAPPPDIIYFQPGVNGGVVALNGTIDANTQHVGLFVPGTGTTLSSADAPIRTANSFVEQGGGDLAMVTWAGGQFPRELWDARNSEYAHGSSEAIADFSYALDQEIAANAESVSGHDVDVTTIGHSYGGAMVGNAQTHGLYTDKVIHVESAGLGDGVESPADYDPPGGVPPESYTMTAPGDPIWWAQNTWVGQGANPTDEPTFTELATGNYPVDHPDPEKAGQPVEGSDAHGGVVQEHTGAWWNIYGVLTDGPVSELPE